jgi:hypothetical protein
LFLLFLMPDRTPRTGHHLIGAGDGLAGTFQGKAEK